MTKISAKNRSRVARLLERHEEIQKMEVKIGKRGISFGITSSNENDDSDYESIDIQNGFAKSAIKSQKDFIVSELKSLGIEVG